MKRRASVLLASIALGIGLLLGWHLHDWLDLDSCLDGGGAWDYSKQTCRYQ